MSQHCEYIDSAFAHAEAAVLPEAAISPSKPWISAATLELISQRRVARSDGDVELEKTLCKDIKSSARKDRRNWLDHLVSSGSWAAARRLRRGRSQKQGRLSDAAGVPVSSEERAGRFAEYLQNVQWKVRPAGLLDDVPASPLLPVKLGPITIEELRAAAKSLKSGKASGPDGTPIEFWKAVLNCGSSAGSKFLLEFCSEIWSGRQVPESWHLQRVVLIYKKGDPADCGNYRPMCLLAARTRFLL